METFDSPTIILGERSEPQPDVVVAITPSHGGQTHIVQIDEEEYFAAWRAVADPIADFLGMQLYAFDPDIALVALDVKGDNTMAIPLWFAKRLLRGIEGG